MRSTFGLSWTACALWLSDRHPSQPAPPLTMCESRQEARTSIRRARTLIPASRTPIPRARTIILEVGTLIPPSRTLILGSRMLIREARTLILEDIGGIRQFSDPPHALVNRSAHKKRPRRGAAGGVDRVLRALVSQSEPHLRPL